jgi:xeroderma pigmentosum group C-complementing protein
VSSCPIDYWAEVYVDKGWVCVDVVNGKVSCHLEMEDRASKPMLYVLAADRAGFVKDVTRRYAKDFAVRVRKARVDQKWLSETLSPFANPRPDERDRREDDQLSKMLEAGPLPSSVAAFKDHPLYALPRHLLKFEAIYPASAPSLGFVKGEPVYARECVHQLHCRVTWMKEGRIVRVNEQAYKVVKARPKWDRMSQSVMKDQPLDLFGRWQTEEYVPPPAKDGKVPRNEYGNVELFKPWMLPKGTVHIPIQGESAVLSNASTSNKNAI